MNDAINNIMDNTLDKNTATMPGSCLVCGCMVQITFDSESLKDVRERLGKAERYADVMFLINGRDYEMSIEQLLEVLQPYAVNEIAAANGFTGARNLLPVSG